MRYNIHPFGLDSLTGVFNELPLGLLSDDVVPLLEALRRYCKKRVLKAAAQMQPDTAPKRRRSNRILGVAPTDVEDCAPRRLAEWMQFVYVIYE